MFSFVQLLSNILLSDYWSSCDIHFDPDSI